ncbi:MAG: hypothetical protein MUC88_14560 [Planctomycetes bacterium]|nr:hypothetical protein [Planctomycetota bacterium]
MLHELGFLPAAPGHPRSGIQQVVRSWIVVEIVRPPRDNELLTSGAAMW